MILWEKEAAHTSSNQMVATMMVDMMQNLRTPLTSLNMATSLLVDYRGEKQSRRQRVAEREDKDARRQRYREEKTEKVSRSPVSTLPFLFQHASLMAQYTLRLQPSHTPSRPLTLPLSHPPSLTLPLTHPHSSSLAHPPSPSLTLSLSHLRSFPLSCV